MITTSTLFRESHYPYMRVVSTSSERTCMRKGKVEENSPRVSKCYSLQRAERGSSDAVIAVPQNKNYPQDRVYRGSS